MPPEKSSQNDWIPTGGIEVVHKGKRAKRGLLEATALASILLSSPAAADPAGKQHYNLEAGALGDALQAVSRLSGREIIFSSEAVMGRRAPHLEGTYSADEAVRRLLSGSGLKVQYRKDVILIGGRSEAPVEDVPRSVESPEILVTGSRIKGAQLASPLMVLSRKDMIMGGHTDLGDVIRSIPQNSGAGQNPGLAFGIPQANGENVGSGSTINLRGLGADSTLVLLNGQRVVYGGYRQAIDIDAIPMEAVERLEILTDGASALYGSDAVAGVANVILRKDFEGLRTSARLGNSTEGGMQSVILGATAGTRWNSGSVMATYQFSRSEGLDASERSYTRDVNPGLTLYPYLRRHNALVNASQEIGNSAHFDLAAVYSWRRDERGFSATAAANSPRYLVGGASWMLAFAPSLTWDVSKDWSVTLAGTYGIDRTRYSTQVSTGGAFTPTLQACFCNTSWSAEVNAQGSAFALPAGDAKVALGGGIRSNSLRAKRTLSSPLDFDVTQDVYYAFGEVNVPLISPDMQLTGIRKLSATAAVRYESYSGLESLATPKLGINYVPVDGLEIKATWGKAFKAATLYQRYNNQIAVVRLATTRGGAGYPSGSTVLDISGGQPDLKAERAETWTATIAATPAALPGLRLEADVFSIRYRNRIATPIAVPGQSLSNPAYASLITLNPSVPQLAAAIEGRELQFNSVGSYDPSKVVAIIDNRVANVAAQQVRGVDISLLYGRDMGPAGRIEANLAGTYLESKQQVVAGSPYTELAGTIYNPPNWRLRGGLSWEKSGTTVTASVNYIGALDDTRSTPAAQIDAQTTVDISIRHETNVDHGILKGVDVIFSVQNLFDKAPPYSRSAYIADPPYDSANYSAIGRFVSLGVFKQW
jgi:outer membrane receptor protein involved in Fe transport